MKQWMKFLAISIAAVGCGDDTSNVCGSGELLTSDAGDVCLFRAELIEEGFSCPAEFSNRTYFDGGAIACGSQEMLPPEIETELVERGYTIDVNANNANNLNNQNNVNNTNNVIDVEGTPITFTLRYQTDVPETVYVQEFDNDGFAGWLTIRRDGVEVQPQITCSEPLCGSNDLGGICAPQNTTAFVEMEFGGDVSYIWEGTTWDTNAADGCEFETAIDPSGVWEAEFCFGFQTQSDGGDGTEIVTPTCATEAFDPAVDTTVEHLFDFGG